jgi:integrase
VRLHLTHFKDGLGIDTPLLSLTQGKLQAFLDSLTPTQAKNHLRTLRALYKQAVKASLCVKNLSTDLTTPEIPKKPPGFFTIEELSALLAWTQEHYPRILPAFLLQVFFGIRTEELARSATTTKRPLQWGDIAFGRAVDVPTAVSKTHERRVVDFWPPAATAWLASYFNPDGSCKEALDSPVAIPNYSAEKSEKIAKSGVKMKQNVFRHTYASYLVAHFQSAERVALLLGHRGSDMLFRHYRDYVAKEQADRFINLKPSSL